MKTTRPKRLLPVLLLAVVSASSAFASDLAKDIKCKNFAQQIRSAQLSAQKGGSERRMRRLYELYVHFSWEYRNLGCATRHQRPKRGGDDRLSEGDARR